MGNICCSTAKTSLEEPDQLKKKELKRKDTEY